LFVSLEHAAITTDGAETSNARTQALRIQRVSSTSAKIATEILGFVRMFVVPHALPFDHPRSFSSPLIYLLAPEIVGRHRSKY
jgi:hypothetical protein